MTKQPLSKRKRRQIARKAKAAKRAGDPNAREPNGQLSRRKADVEARGEMNEAQRRAWEKDNMSVAVGARMRQFGLSEEQAAKNEAGRPNAGNVHGRMRLLGIEIERRGKPLPSSRVLSADQWTAAEWYIQTHGKYLKSILAKGDSLSAGSNTVSTDDSASYVEWCKQVAARWRAIADCLRDLSTKRRSPVAAAFDVILLKNHYLEHLESDLKAGLDALYDRFIKSERTKGGDGARLSEAQLNANAGSRA